MYTVLLAERADRDETKGGPAPQFHDFPSIQDALSFASDRTSVNCAGNYWRRAHIYCDNHKLGVIRCAL